VQDAFGKHGDQLHRQHHGGDQRQPGGGTLSGTTTLSAVSGVATFSNLSIDKSGAGYTLTAASER